MRRILLLLCSAVLAVGLAACELFKNDVYEGQSVTRLKPLADFTFDSTDCAESSPCSMVFTNISTGAVSYIWSFGNNQVYSTSSKNAITIEYRTPGSFVVTLTAIAANGEQASAQRTVTINGPAATYANVTGFKFKGYPEFNYGDLWDAVASNNGQFPDIFLQMSRDYGYPPYNWNNSFEAIQNTHPDSTYFFDTSFILGTYSAILNNSSSSSIFFQLLDKDVNYSEYMCYKTLNLYNYRFQRPDSLPITFSNYSGATGSATGWAYLTWY
jgi:PKD domain